MGAIQIDVIYKHWFNFYMLPSGNGVKKQTR